MEGLSYKLDAFEGPLDLLLALISKNKLNILDINISELLEQYMGHIKLMEQLNMDVASEFLEMASRLVYIKTAMLLPHQEEAEQLKQELTGELLEYQTCKEMAEKLSELSNGLGHFSRLPMPAMIDKTYRRTHEVNELYLAYFEAVGRGDRLKPPPIDSFKPLVERKIYAVSTKVIHILHNLRKKAKLKYKSLFSSARSRSELVATFLAVLELVKAHRVEVNGENDNLTVSMCNGGEKDV